ncbi:MAG: YncE family protein, partial [Pirellulales bacterium]
MVSLVLLSLSVGFQAGIPARPAQSMSIALTPDEKTVCVANQDSGTVSLLAWSTDDELREIAVGDEPRTVAVSPAGDLLYVTTQRSQELAVVDIEAGRCTGRIPIGGQPVGVVLSTDGRVAYVAQYAGEYLDGKYVPGAVAMVDLVAGKVTARIGVKPRPFALALSADGKTLYVTHFFQVDGRGFVTVIDTEGFKVRCEIPLDADDDVTGGRGGVFNALASFAIHPQG